MKNLFSKLAAVAALTLAFACGNDSPVAPPHNIATTGVELNQKTLYLMRGDVKGLRALLLPSSATNRSVAWTTSDASVATVVGNGLDAAITAHAAGAAAITVKAADGAAASTCTVIVEDRVVHVAGVAVDRQAMSLVPGGFGRLTATVQPFEATNKGVTWTSSDAGVATVSGSGSTVFVTAGASTGSATITATTADGGKTATCAVTVNTYTVPVTGVSLNNASLDVANHGTATLTAAVNPPNAADTSVSWSTSDASVATVAGGAGMGATITAIGPGQATITVAASGFKATCAVRVYVVMPTAITLDKTTMDVALRGGGVALSATLSPTNVTERNVSWTSSDTSVLAVSGSGPSAMLSPVAPGNAVITAKASDVVATCAVRVIDKPKVVQIKPHTPAFTGYNSTFAVKTDGSLWAWGVNTFGQLGVGDTTLRSVPTKVGADTDWASIAAGSYHTAAIKNDGSLWVWGLNSNGQLGLGDTTDRSVPTRVGAETDWATVAVGSNHTMAIKKDGSLWAFGRNVYGYLGLGDTVTRNVPTRVSTGTNWAAVVCSVYHTVGLRDDGSLWAWGDNAAGRLGLGDTAQRTSPVQVGTAEDWRALAVGESHTLAIKSNGSLWAWGSNASSKLGISDAAQRLSPTMVGTDVDWVSVGGGGSHTAALKKDGSAWAWGSNYYGQVGDGTATNEFAAPTRVAANEMGTVSAMLVGGNHNAAVRSDGSLWTWGNNSLGQLGDNLGTTTRNLPYLVDTGFRVPKP